MASEFDASKMDAYDAVAFGCPAMGAEVLEEGEFQPMFDSVEGNSAAKRLGCSVLTDGETESGCVTGKRAAGLPERLLWMTALCAMRRRMMRRWRTARLWEER